MCEPSASSTEDNEDNLWLAFGLTLGAGLATTIGSSTACVVSLRNKSLLSGGLSLAAGVMIYVSFAEILMVKSVDGFKESDVGEKYAHAAAAGCFFAGVGLCALLNLCVHRLMGYHHAHHIEEAVPHFFSAGDLQIEAHDAANMSSGDEANGCVVERRRKESRDHEKDLERADSVVVADKQMSSQQLSLEVDTMSSSRHLVAEVAPSKRDQEHEHDLGSDHELRRMGLMSGLAIAIHNVPEGLATFVATLDDPSVGFAIALAIAIHNIPEGVCVAMPVFYATGSRWQAFWWSFLSGVSEPIGALLGYFLLREIFTDFVYAVLFGLVAGMMAYISFAELLPTARRYDPENKVVQPALWTGMAIMALSLVLFSL